MGKSPEQIREAGRLRMAAWRAKNPDNCAKSRVLAREWKKKNAADVKEYAREYKRLNRAKFRAYEAARFARNPEHVLEINRQWRLKNPEKYHKSKADWAKNRRSQRRPRDLVLNALRRSLAFYVKKSGGMKSRRAKELFGCSVDDLRTHLEKQFRDRMSWDNYGSFWHIDHIKPCASFDFLNPEHQQVCFHFSNLQPLTAEENRIKGASYAGD